MYCPQSFYQHVFNGFYAVLLFVVVIFFLIYGVEVYFKVSAKIPENVLPSNSYLMCIFNDKRHSAYRPAKRVSKQPN